MSQPNLQGQTQISPLSTPSGVGTLLSMYRTMVRIRAFEERTAELVEAGQIRTWGFR